MLFGHTEEQSQTCYMLKLMYSQARFLKTIFTLNLKIAIEEA